MEEGKGFPKLEFIVWEEKQEDLLDGMEDSIIFDGQERLCLVIQINKSISIRYCHFGGEETKRNEQWW